MRTEDRAPALLFAGLAAAAFVILLVLADPLTFFYDEWEVITDRREWTADALLIPHNEHLSLIPIVVYKLLLTTFGLDSQQPFQVVLAAVVIVDAVLVFVWVRRRVGDWLALAATVPLLMLGSSAFNLLWSFQITLMGSMAFGLGALLALDRDDRRGDRLACAVLVASIAAHSPGLAFTVGAAAGVLRRPDRRQRAYIFLIPIALYLAWRWGWGFDPKDDLTLGQILHSPIFVLNGFASSISSLLGLVVNFDGLPIDPLRWGRPLLVVAIALAAWRLWRLRAVSASLATVLGTGIAFWAMTAVAGGVGRTPTNGRYQYLGAVFAILIAAELWRGSRPGRAGIATAMVISALALVGNWRAFDEPRNFLEVNADITRTRLAAAEVAGRAADPATKPILGVTLGPYLGAVEEYGSPALDEGEIAAADEEVKVTVDKTFEELYGLEAAAAGSPDTHRCVVLPPGHPSTTEIAPERAVVVVPRGPTALAMRRYAEVQFPVDLGGIEAGSPAEIGVPADNSDVPWTLAVTSEEPARVCAAPQG